MKYKRLYWHLNTAPMFTIFDTELTSEAIKIHLAKVDPPYCLIKMEREDGVHIWEIEPLPPRAKPGSIFPYERLLSVFADYHRGEITKEQLVMLIEIWQTGVVPEPVDASQQQMRFMMSSFGSIPVQVQPIGIITGITS